MKTTVIYIVDDDEAVRQSTRMLLRSYGWQAQAFGSAEEFLEALPKVGAPDCLLLDLNMPGMDGAELLETLAVEQPTIPVIVITGQRNSNLAIRARNAGAREVFDKPFRDEELKASIERALAA